MSKCYLEFSCGEPKLIHATLSLHACIIWILYIDGLVEKRRNSSALAMELRLYCAYPSMRSNPFARFPPIQIEHDLVIKDKLIKNGEKRAYFPTPYADNRFLFVRFLSYKSPINAAKPSWDNSSKQNGRNMIGFDKQIHRYLMLTIYWKIWYTWKYY